MPDNVSTFCISATMKKKKDAKQVIIEWKIGCFCVSFSKRKSRISTRTSNDDESLKILTLYNYDDKDDDDEDDRWGGNDAQPLRSI